MGAECTVDPATDPVTLAEAKEYALIDHDEQDTIVTNLITAATDSFERQIQRRCITQTWAEYFDEFPDVFRPLWSPLSSVTSIGYTDGSGDAQTLAASNYVLDAKSEPGRIAKAYGATWPTTYDEVNVVTLTYVCGYGAAADVPEPVKTAIKWLVKYWYGPGRDIVAVGTITKEMEEQLKRIAAQYWVGTQY